MNKIQRETAIEEWKLLESIIGRQEQIIFQMRRWLYALITALIIAYISGKATLLKCEFLLLGIVLIVLFLVVECLQRGPLRRAIKRAKSIEASIRGPEPYEKYNGPELSDRLSSSRFRDDFYDAINELIVTRVWFPYGILGLIIVLVFLFVPRTN